MGAVFQKIGSEIKVSPATHILKQEEYSQFIQAKDLIAQANVLAQEIKQKAEEAYNERKEEGYADGVAEGQMQQAEKMLETGMQAVEYIEGLERQIVDVVITAVRKIIGDLDDKERIVRIVRTALEQVRGRQSVTVRISPEEEAYVHEAFAAMVGKGQGALEIVPDVRMKRGDCVLESQMGVLEASLDIQLKAIENALKAKIGGDAER
ncbi:MAG: HrpE/YscL family type III secretion apparatus protein [Desulfovibrionaceae bacterium]|nr:HrpE/YscL family type III secretion apparatus protein [Desulfovibrionaceae bacterium]